MRKIITVCSILLVSGCLSELPAKKDVLGPADVGVRHLLVAESGLEKAAGDAGAGLDGAVYTDSVNQYAAFFQDKGALWLGKRRIGEDSWQKRSTAVQLSDGAARGAGVKDLVVDDAGYLHVVWLAGKGNSLQYARGMTPDSLNLSGSRTLVRYGKRDVSKPHFVKLPDEGVSLFYENKSGAVVASRFDSEVESRLGTPSLVVGTGLEAEIKWDLYQQLDGKIHLSWRKAAESNPDYVVRTYYAYSNDGGQTWRKSDASEHTLPIQDSEAEVVTEVPAESDEIQPLQIVADTNGTAYIGSYSHSSGGQDAGEFRVSYRNGANWSSITAPEAVPKPGPRATPDTMPNVALIAETRNGIDTLHLIYQDGVEGGRLIAASNRPGEAEWQYRYLTDGEVDRWVPSVDPRLWQRMRQAQLLFRNAEGELKLLIWSTDWEHHLRQYATGDIHENSSRTAKDEKDVFAARTIMDYARRVAQWQWDNMPDPNGWHFEQRAWGVCPLYIGTLDVVPALNHAGFDGDKLYETMVRQAESVNYSLRDESPYDADDYCVTQAYLRLYQDKREERILKHSKDRLNDILSNPSPHNLDWGYRHSRDRWSWSDALYMGPMSWLLMWEATGDDRYLEFMNREWWATTARLYRPEIGLFFRDESYLDVREKNGRTVHWARGTSWSFAGLAQIIEHFPKSHPDYPRYVEQFRQMAETFAKVQQDDGLWRPGLLDPETHNARETSGSSFISFGLASGINQGILERSKYLPHVKKAWRALTASVSEDGKLMNVQPVGAGPHGFDPDNSEPFAAGAFLQLAAELYEMPDLAGEQAEVFTVTNPDYRLSPYTGMTRKHWEDAARYLLEGAFNHVDDLDDSMIFPEQPGKSDRRKEGITPTERLEGMARTLLTVASLLREEPGMRINDVPVAEYYRHQLAELVNPESEKYIRPRKADQGPKQILVEFGALAISLFIARDTLWDPLDQDLKDELARTMLSYGDGPTVPSNWKFFNIFVLSFLQDQGYAVNEQLLTEYLEKSLNDYRGQGWYNDNPAYDYYSMWGYQMYGALWSELYGKENYPDLAQQFMNNFRDMAESYPLLFSKDGEMVMWGRSISYRFASVSPLSLLEYTNDESINYGWMRRIASGTLLQFLKHPDFLEDGVPTLGFYGPFEPAVQQYSVPGSVYWAGKAFFGLLLPEDSAYWQATENLGPWEHGFDDRAVENHFYPESDILITNYTSSGASEIRAWCHVGVIDNWEAFRGSENYNRLSYNTAFPWQKDGVNGEVAMNYVVKNRESEWEAFRLFTFKAYDDGIYYRDAVLETDDRVKFQLTDVPLPNGILRVDRNISTVPVEFRVGHYALPDLGRGIKQTVRVVDDREVHIIDNGEYQLATVPLSGWNSIETLRLAGHHPQSEFSSVTNLGAGGGTDSEAGGIYSALMLWKRSGEAWSAEELNPIKTIAVSETGSGVHVALRNGREIVVRFDVFKGG